MKDKTHAFSEALVILTDFYLFRKYNESLFIDYCKEFSIDDCSEKKAREKYYITNELSNKMDKLLLSL
ncbi:hypothetical protein CFB3_44580 [Clostridium folliculivorans]|nr:hypothetical protein CFB3_44580 [Clostridium folliculivorans]